MFLGGVVCNFRHFVSTGCMNCFTYIFLSVVCDHVCCLLSTEGDAVFLKGGQVALMWQILGLAYVSFVWTIGRRSFFFLGCLSLKDFLIQ